MVKILHVISDKNIGGAGRLLLNLLKEADRGLFDFSVILPHGSLLKPEIQSLGVKVIESDLGFFELYRIIGNENPQIVHTHAAATARIAAKLRGAVTVNTRHCASEESGKIPAYKKAATRLFDALFTNATVATAHYVKAVLIGEGIPKNKITVVINGSRPIAEFPEQKKLEIRHRLGYSKDDFLAGMIARLEEGKGQETFIEAARICQKSAPQIKFLIAGNGSAEPQLKAQAQALDNLKFLGFLPDVTEIMNVIDANVNCSYISETSSLSLSEGMSVGAIPVVSDCGGNRFMADDCGVIFPKKDAKALAEALINLSRALPEKSSLLAASKQKFSNLLTAQRMAKETENLYLGLLKSALRIDKALKIWLNKI